MFRVPHATIVLLDEGQQSEEASGAWRWCVLAAGAQRAPAGFQPGQARMQG
jgi:hypothetical protein